MSHTDIQIFALNHSHTYTRIQWQYPWGGFSGNDNNNSNNYHHYYHHHHRCIPVPQVNRSAPSQFTTTYRRWCQRPKDRRWTQQCWWRCRRRCWWRQRWDWPLCCRNLETLVLFATRTAMSHRRLGNTYIKGYRTGKDVHRRSIIYGETHTPKCVLWETQSPPWETHASKDIW